MVVLALLAITAVVQLKPPTAYDYKQVQLAASGNSVTATFTWQNKIMFSSSSDRGATWSEPVVVAEPGMVSSGRHRGPRVAFSGDALVISAIVGQKGGGKDGDLLTWRSTDRGQTWKQAARINDVEASAREGLHAMAPGPGGLVYAAWLDLRKPGTRLYGSVSRDGGATWSANEEIYSSPDGSICQCCHPSLAIDAKGTIFVMWRNALGGNRDFYYSFSTNSGKTFAKAEKLGIGSWKLDACPMDGGSIAIGKNSKPVTVWRREDAIYITMPDDLEREVHTGKDPSVAFGRDGAYIAWQDVDGIQVRTPGRVEPTTLDPEGSYVQLASLGDGTVLAAWERKGTIRFERIR